MSEAQPKINNSLRGLSLRVMALLKEAPTGDPYYMSTLIKVTGKASDQLVPVVRRLVRKGWVEVIREEGRPVHTGSLRRFLYITDDGRKRLAEAYEMMEKNQFGEYYHRKSAGG
jgi:DNA-binding MarR family transcriptional regulator